MSSSLLKQLLELLVRIQYISKAESKGFDLDRMRPTALYNSNAEFKRFVDNHTGYLSKSTDFKNRWLHFRSGATEEKLCPTCNKSLPNFRKTYCCHTCSTLAPKTGRKTGPKVDLDKKLKALKAKLPDYKILKIGQRQSLFRHLCGVEFEAPNGRTAGLRLWPEAKKPSRLNPTWLLFYLYMPRASR